MGRPREFDMDEAVAAATKLFWRGYDRTSLADLTGAQGISPASFYFAFGSKEALFRRVVDRYIDLQAEAFDRAFAAPTAAAGVAALLRGYVDVVTDNGHAPGCLVVNSAPSAGAVDPLRQWLAGHREALRVRLEHQFGSRVAHGELPEIFDVKAMARFIVTVSGGLAVEAQSGASRQDLYAIIDLALAGFPASDAAARAEGQSNHASEQNDRS